MARIYNRDNINYSGLIGQAIQNANQTSQLYANKWLQPGTTMGQGVRDVGNKLQESGWTEWGAQQEDARARAKLQAQQDFQAEQNELNRDLQWDINEANLQNAKEIALINKNTQNAYDLLEAEKNLTKWKLIKSDEAAKGHDTRAIDAEITKITKKFPSLADQPLTGEAPDPRGTVEYKISRYKDRDAGNSSSSELEGFIKEMEQFNTPESAAQLSRLEGELERRRKMETTQEAIKNDTAYFKKTGILSPYLQQLGYTYKSTNGGWQLYDPKGKPVYGKIAPNNNKKPKDPIP